jgi:hypothetical protein
LQFAKGLFQHIFCDSNIVALIICKVEIKSINILQL